jgi:hypothetical protein
MVKYKPKVAKAKNYLNSRQGSFEDPEDLYVNTLIEYFKKSILDIDDFYPLRIFLAHCLGRNCMSISKRFTRKNKIGKQRYKFPKIIRVGLKKQKRFETIQSAFKKTLTEKEKSKILWPKVLLKENNKPKIENTENSKTINLQVLNKEIEDCFYVISEVEFMNIFFKYRLFI